MLSKPRSWCLRKQRHLLLNTRGRIATTPMKLSLALPWYSPLFSFVLFCFFLPLFVHDFILFFHFQLLKIFHPIFFECLLILSWLKKRVYFSLITTLTFLPPIFLRLSELFEGKTSGSKGRQWRECREEDEGGTPLAVDGLEARLLVRAGVWRTFLEGMGGARGLRGLPRCPLLPPAKGGWTEDLTVRRQLLLCVLIWMGDSLCIMVSFCLFSLYNQFVCLFVLFVP